MLASKNSSNYKSSSYVQGLSAEYRVFKELKNRNVTILYHRLKTYLGEVDIVALSPQGTLILIEVKSSRPNLDSRQRRRLLTLKSYIIEAGFTVDVYYSYLNKEKLCFLRLDS